MYDYHGDGRERGIRAFGDASGNASFVYNSNDKLITLNQGKGTGMDRAEVSHFVYDSANQILAKYHDSGKGNARDRIEYLYAQGNPVAETGVKIEGGAFTLMDTENYALFQHYSKDFPGGSMMSYTVNSDGETLQSIANAMYGNPSQWYLIAGANGLSGSEKLKAGQVLSVPSKNSSGEIDESAHKTYNENEIIGSKLPNLQTPPPKKKKCASLLMILVVIIAVVVTIYTAGLAASALAPAVATGGAGAFSTGLAVLGGTSAFTAGTVVAAAAIGGAVGSVASQAFAVGVGLQESISWKSVALSALGAGITAGIGSLGVFSTASKVLNAGLNAAVSNVASQGLAIAFKMQDKFSWRQVAAAGVGAAVGSKLGELFKASSYGGGMLEKGVTASAQSITSQLIATGKVNWRTVGVDGVIAAASFQVKEKFKDNGWGKTIADGLLGAGAAALRKENVLAGAYTGVAGSLISQYGSKATGAEAALYKGLVGAGTAALTRQDIAAGFIGGATGSLVGEYVLKGVQVLGVDPTDLNAGTTGTGKRLGISPDDILTQIVGAIGSGVAKTVAEWAGRDVNTAAMIGTATASKAYNDAVTYGRQDRTNAALIDSKAKRIAEDEAIRSKLAETRAKVLQVNPGGEALYDRMLASGRWTPEQAADYASRSSFSEIGANEKRVSELVIQGKTATEIFSSYIFPRKEGTILQKDDGGTVKVVEGETIGMKTLSTLGKMSGDIQELTDKYHVNDIMMVAQFAMGPLAATKELLKGIVGDKLIGEYAQKAINGAATQVSAMAHGTDYDTLAYALDVEPAAPPGKDAAAQKAWVSLNESTEKVHLGSLLVTGALGGAILGGVMYMHSPKGAASPVSMGGPLFNQRGAINPGGQRGSQSTSNDIEVQRDIIPSQNPDVANSTTALPISGETSATATGKSVHSDLAAERRASGAFDSVNEPIRDANGVAVQVTKRVDLRTGEPLPESGFQIARPDAVQRDVIIDDKPLGRPIAKDQQEIIRFINAYQERNGALPRTIGIQRYDPKTGLPSHTELYVPSDFMPWSKK